MSDWLLDELLGELVGELLDGLLDELLNELSESNLYSQNVVAAAQTLSQLSLAGSLSQQDNAFLCCITPIALSCCTVLSLSLVCMYIFIYPTLLHFFAASVDARQLFQDKIQSSRSTFSLNYLLWFLFSRVLFRQKCSYTLQESMLSY